MRRKRPDPASNKARVSAWRRTFVTTLRGGWLKTTAEIAGVLSLIVAIIAIFVQISGSSSPDPRQAPPGDLVPFDDFTGAAINAGKWKLQYGDAQLIHAEGGLLHLQATPEGEAKDEGAVLQALLAGPVTEVMFDMTLVSTSGDNYGGGFVEVSNKDGRRHMIWLKPGINSPPGVDYYICHKSLCDPALYADFSHDDPHIIQLQHSYPVHIHQNDAGWIFEVGNFEQVVTEPEHGPITGLAFALFSNGAGFHVTVDNVRVAYA